MSRMDVRPVVSWLAKRLGAGAIAGAVFAAALCGGLRAELPSSSPPGIAFALPTEPEDWKFVDSVSESAPAALRALAERTGVAWSAVWDPALEVPYFAFPHEPCGLGGPGAPSGPEDVAAAARAFLERNQDVFGAGPENLSELEVVPVGEGYQVAAAQVHAGIPVRGALLRMRVNGDGTIRSVGATLARELPELEAVEFSEAERLAWAERAKEEHGLAEVLSVEPWILFSGSVSSAFAGVVVVGIDLEDREREIFCSLGGALLLDRTTAVGFDGEMGMGAGCDEHVEAYLYAKGYCPDPKDPYRVPADIDPKPYPVPRLRISFNQAACVNGASWHLSNDGFLEGRLLTTLDPRPYTFSVEFHESRFVLREGLDSYVKKESWVARGNLHWEKTYNLWKDEFESLHLFVYHHLHNCALQTEILAYEHNLPYAWRSGDSVNAVKLGNGDYRHAYEPESGRWTFYSDQVNELGTKGLRKITPTIIYHEYAHEFVNRLAGAEGEAGVVEGVADAFATYMAKASLLGYDSQRNPVDDEIARDLREDTVPYPGDARRVVAGALWELWEATREPPPEDAKPQDIVSESPFAWAVLARWVASRRGPTSQPQGKASLPYYWGLGIEFYIEADYEPFEGDGNIKNGVPSGEHIVGAFGRRNLFPTRFNRGDANGDGALNISDALRILGYLFLGDSETGCPDAFDADDDGALTLTDAVRLLGYLFLGQERLPEPFNSCTPDPTPGDGMGCWESPCPVVP